MSREHHYPVLPPGLRPDFHFLHASAFSVAVAVKANTCAAEYDGYGQLADILASYRERMEWIRAFLRLAGASVCAVDVRPVDSLLPVQFRNVLQDMLEAVLIESEYRGEIGHGVGDRLMVSEDLMKFERIRKNIHKRNNRNGTRELYCSKWLIHFTFTSEDDPVIKHQPLPRELMATGQSTPLPT